jgi:haloacetate dehalogenase
LEENNQEGFKIFEKFTEERIKGDGATLFVRHGGPQDAPPLVLLHGYPQTSAMWHSVAPILARSFQVVCLDLRGYGKSEKPVSDTSHFPFSKRAMAQDIVAVMKNLGHDKFFVGAHDRGARVAHRLGLDHPDSVKSMVLLDIAPTREMYAGTNTKFARAYWHWFFLIQPHPLPEQIISKDPEAFWKLKCFNQTRGKNPFSKEALAEYLDAFKQADTIHSSCEDYRAAASIDIEHDNADQEKKLLMPILALWAKHGVIETCFDALKLWRLRANQVEGEALQAGHYMAEEIPDEVAARMSDFFLTV